MVLIVAPKSDGQELDNLLTVNLFQKRLLQEWLLSKDTDRIQIPLIPQDVVVLCGTLGVEILESVGHRTN